MVEDETALCSILEGFDHTDGEGCVCLGEGEVGGGVVDTVCGHDLRCGAFKAMVNCRRRGRS